MEFKVVRKGYDRKDVDGYIAKLERDNAELIRKQQEVNEQLKAELAEKEQKIADFESKSKKISDALILAVSKADEIEKLAVYKYNQEMEMLKSFHARWLTYYARLMKKYPISEDLLAVKDFNDRVNRILDGAVNGGEDNSSERFREEYNRLIKQNGVLEGEGEDDIPSFEPSGFIKLDDEPAFTEKPVKSAKTAKTAYVSNPDARRVAPNLTETVSESGFSFEEALNPKQSLEEIMADLNDLMGDEDNK